jgi:hypothetical protein
MDIDILGVAYFDAMNDFDLEICIKNEKLEDSVYRRVTMKKYCNGKLYSVRGYIDHMIGEVYGPGKACMQNILIARLYIDLGRKMKESEK